MFSKILLPILLLLGAVATTAMLIINRPEAARESQFLHAPWSVPSWPNGSPCRIWTSPRARGSVPTSAGLWAMGVPLTGIFAADYAEVQLPLTQSEHCMFLAFSLRYTHEKWWYIPAPQSNV